MLRRGRVWVLLWDADEIDAVAPPATATQRRGARATISDPDGLIPCLECGRRYRSLGRHLHAAHQLTAVAYRARHGLPATAALRADGDRERSAQYWRQRLAVDPDAVDHWLSSAMSRRDGMPTCMWTELGTNCADAD